MRTGGGLLATMLAKLGLDITPEQLRRAYDAYTKFSSWLPKVPEQKWQYDPRMVSFMSKFGTFTGRPQSPPDLTSLRSAVETSTRLSDVLGSMAAVPMATPKIPTKHYRGTTTSYIPKLAPKRRSGGSAKRR